MEVLIVSKTHMTNAACVGGLVLCNNTYLRLLNNGGYNQPIDTSFKVGDVWDVTFTRRPNLHPPHVEDVIVSTKRFLRKTEDVAGYLEEIDVIDWDGHIDNLYDGLLHWTNSGSAYIPIDGEMPNQSVGFWTSDRTLTKSIYKEKTRFSYPNGRNYRHVSYVGYQDSIDTIPAGTIIRVSLSRVFPPEGSPIQVPKGYYLQLSGWYL